MNNDIKILKDQLKVRDGKFDDEALDEITNQNIKKISDRLKDL